MADETKKFMSADNLLYVWQKIKLELQKKTDKVDGKGLSTNDYTDAEKEKLATLNNYVDTEIRNLIASINSKIPEEATSTNQLADKEFVNSSIATNTSSFRGTYESVDDLPTESSVDGLKVNDYAFVITTNKDGNPEYNRYKYTVSGTTKEWSYEYTLNNSSFTKAQWLAIQSGITSSLVEQITTNKNALEGLSTFALSLDESLGVLDANKAEKDIVSNLSTRVTKNEKDIAIKANKADLATVATTGSYDDLTSKPTIPTVDSSLNTTSTNAIQNKAVKTELDKKLNKSDYVVDTAVSSTSTNPVTSSALYTLLLGKAPSYQPLKSASFTLSGSRLYLTLKNQLDEAIAEPNVSLATIVPEELTNAEIDTIFAS
jgi:hypothetical protein